MTALSDLLGNRIRSEGPLPISTFMTECMLNPVHGYYATRDPFGQAGDFTTAPEISQMFGELVGLTLAQAWLDRGSPAEIRLVELGPGRGTLMADVLRATKAVPGFLNAIDLHLIEASPVLRDAQCRTIRHALTHHETLEGVPGGPLFLIANEFFDALPIRQFVRDGEAWRERVVGLEGDRLIFGLSELTAPSSLADRLADTKDCDMVEISAPVANVAREIAARISADGGVALVFDYGDWHSLGDTFQAVKSHETTDPLATPGEADLTAHVDFAVIADGAAACSVSRLTPQGVFLERLGITQRAEALAANLSGGDLERHVAAHRRLTHPDEMGTLFKALAIFAPGSPLPPGFAP